jgi:hypothetical protein
MSQQTECPRCGLNWIEAQEMLSSPPGSEAYTLGVRVLGYCQRVCKEVQEQIVTS